MYAFGENFSLRRWIFEDGDGDSGDDYLYSRSSWWWEQPLQHIFGSSLMEIIEKEFRLKKKMVTTFLASKKVL